MWWLQALKGAKHVHTFVRDADDAIEWIQEKDTLVSSPDFGQDLQSVQALIVKHEGFEVRWGRDNFCTTDFVLSCSCLGGVTLNYQYGDSHYKDKTGNAQDIKHILVIDILSPY